MSYVPTAMRAVRIERFGDSDVVQLATIAVPRPQSGEVLVRVAAASLNPVDAKIRSGKYLAVTPQMLPYTLGRDFAGTIVARGRESAPAADGDGNEVFGLLDIARGSFAEYLVARVGELAPRPVALSAVEAAAVPLAGLTAWQGLFRHGDLQPGQRVLIHAAAGGVGHFAVQFAKAKGAYVIATTSTDNLEFVRSLRADEVIDYKRQKFEDEVVAVDLVYDLVGGETQARSWAVLKRGGTLISTLTEPPQDKAAALDVRAMRYTVQPDAAELQEIATLIDTGKVKPTVSRTAAVTDARAALDTVEKGHTLGKAVLAVA